jgi:hypothetical protein
MVSGLRVIRSDRARGKPAIHIVSLFRMNHLNKHLQDASKQFREMTSAKIGKDQSLVVLEVISYLSNFHFNSITIVVSAMSGVAGT